MFNVSLTNTLRYDPATCNGCGMCLNVCPHGVFARNGRGVHVVRPDACMECGACQVNCPTDAIAVESGQPIFFFQRRSAMKNGKEFNFIKFRSMVSDAERP